MTSRTIAIALLCALPGFAQSSAAESPVQDTDGWGKIKWGMTAAQVRSLYGPDLREAVAGRGSRYTTRFTLPAFQIGDLDMDVSFQTAPSSDRIARVALSLPAGAKLPAFAADFLCNALVRKYGRPRRSATETRGSMKETTWVWPLPSTTITLNWMHSDAAGFSILDLTYEAVDKQALGVL